MKELQAQIRDECPKCKQRFGRFLLPYGDESKDSANSYRPNQIVNAKVKGIKKERSIRQLNTYWAVCQTVADNTEDKQWGTKEKVDFQARVRTHFVDPNLLVVRGDGEVIFHYRSIAKKNLGHIEACRYFDQAFEVMAQFLGTDTKELVSMAKEQMQSY